MFVYNTRTEIDQGTTFIEKDIILFDYTYSGDMVFQVNALLRNSGFGFVIKEDDGDDIQSADNIVLITIANNGAYRVILQNNGEQVTAVSRFVDNGMGLYDPEGEIFLFKKHDETLSVYKTWYDASERMMRETKLLSYRMQYDMNSYRIGIYSNQGNTVRFASVQTEAPSNWIANVFNAGGGRIKWIENGFTIDEAEYEIEVESVDIPMHAGTYWFDYETNNRSGIKAFIYESERHHTNLEIGRRSREEIIETMVDEEKNILQEDGSFTLATDHAINVKFRGTWGTVKNICIKDNKLDDFVETEYGTTMRPRSWLRFDLNIIKEIDIDAKILSVAVNDENEQRQYSIFRRGLIDMGMVAPIKLNQTFSYHFTTDTNMLQINNMNHILLPGSSQFLFAFDNVSAVITKFIVTLHDGTVVDILLQKTIKYMIVNTIDSPILVFNMDYEPMDLASSYRKVATIRPRLELFNAINPITLARYPDITNANVQLYGIPYNKIVDDNQVRITVRKNAATIQEMADYYEKIPYTLDRAALLKKSIKLPYTTRKKYQYIAISYRAIDEFRYWFTNCEREIYDLEESPQVYLTHNPLDPNYDLTIYAIADPELFNKDLLYYTTDEDIDTSIDLAAWEYKILSPRNDTKAADYKVNALGKVVLDKKILKQYRYLIIDYLKVESFTVNERNDNYEVDIVSSDNKAKIIYDSKDGTTTQKYRLLSSISKMIKENKEDETEYIIQENDFVVLETES